MHLINIEHRTTYTYPQSVVLKPHRLLLRPRDGFDLRIRSSTLTIEPKSNIHWARDIFGNSITIATFTERTDRLDILSSVVVEQYRDTTLDITAMPELDQGLEEDNKDPSALLAPYTIRSAPMIEGAHWSKCERISSRPDDAFRLLSGLCKVLREHIHYSPRNEPGVQSPIETAQCKSGCCRDIAWLFIQATRQAGFASRFVSGYLVDDQSETNEPSNPGATHAWAETYLPSYGWLGFDPTLGRPVGPKHIAVAVADRPDSICPVSGAFIGPIGTTSNMTVTVKCTQADTPRAPKTSNLRHTQNLETFGATTH